MCGFQFESQDRPFSIFYFCQSFFTFVFVYIEAVITSKQAFLIFYIACAVFALVGWLIFYFFFDLSEEKPEVLGSRRS